MPQESHDDAARREFQEETGVKESLVQRVYSLRGRPVNPNDTYFVANSHKKEGVKFFGLSVKADEVELRRNSSDARLRVYKFKPDLQGQITEMNERINPAGIRFFHVDLLQNTSDGFTQIAIGKILRSFQI